MTCAIDLNVLELYYIFSKCSLLYLYTNIIDSLIHKHNMR